MQASWHVWLQQPAAAWACSGWQLHPQLPTWLPQVPILRRRHFCHLQQRTKCVAAGGARGLRIAGGQDVAGPVHACRRASCAAVSVALSLPRTAAGPQPAGGAAAGTAALVWIVTLPGADREPGLLRVGLLSEPAGSAMQMGAEAPARRAKRCRRRQWPVPLRPCSQQALQTRSIADVGRKAGNRRVGSAVA